MKLLHPIPTAWRSLRYWVICVDHIPKTISIVLFEFSVKRTIANARSSERYQTCVVRSRDVIKAPLSIQDKSQECDRASQGMTHKPNISTFRQVWFESDQRYSKRRI